MESNLEMIENGNSKAEMKYFDIYFKKFLEFLRLR
jgi:hypothetical protein